MTGNIHRILMTLGAIGAGVGSLIGTDTTPLGIPPEAGAWFAFAAAVAIMAANAVRANWPDKPATP